LLLPPQALLVGLGPALTPRPRREKKAQTLLVPVLARLREAEEVQDLLPPGPLTIEDTVVAVVEGFVPDQGLPKPTVRVLRRLNRRLLLERCWVYLGCIRGLAKVI